MPTAVDDINRLLKPIRGIALLGNRQDKEVIDAWVAKANQVASSAGGWEYYAKDGGCWAKRVRPPLANTGGWQGPMGGPGKTNGSQDGALKGPLGVVWYGPPYLNDTQGRPALIANGVMVCPIDADTVETYDQYNGRLLWRYTAKGFGGRDDELPNPVRCHDGIL